MSYYIVGGLHYSDELYHWGVNGMKWGVRRYQNKDGSLTAEGRRHYGVSDATKNRVKNAVKTVGSQAAKAAKSATAYTAKRTKMRHPEFMSDDELRNYTQRLIAEKNYSDLLRYQRANSGFGKAKAYVGDIIKRGGNTVADAAFRKIASKISKTKGERELENLQRENAIQALKDKFEDRTLQRQIDQMQQQNRLNDLRDQLNDADGAQAQKKELERLQRENQLADLRNKLDPTRLDQQKQIDDLNQKKMLRDLEKALDPNKSGGGLAAAMQIIGDPNSTASQIQEAKQVLQNYNFAQNFMEQIKNRGESIPVSDFSSNSSSNPVSDSGPIPSANPEPSSASPSYEVPRDYTPIERTGYPSNDPDYSRYRMPPVDNSGGGMYGGRLHDYQMPSFEGQSKTINPYADYRMPSEEDLRYGNGPRRRSLRG